MQYGMQPEEHLNHGDNRRPPAGEEGTEREPHLQHLLGSRLRGNDEPLYSEGTWVAREIEGDGYLPQWIVEHDVDLELGVCAMDRCNPRQEANARLIAAAPELIEALIEVVEEYEGYSDGWEEDSVAHAIVKNARALIAKATTLLEA